MSNFLAQTPERKLWYDGPNYTADAVIIDPSTEEILLITRRDTGDLALPGGFIDTTDWSSFEAAAREAREEAGVSHLMGGHLVYQGRTSDQRSSETAWIETSAHLFYASSATEVCAGDDAAAATWHHLDSLPALYGAHDMIIRRALDYRASNKCLERIVEHSTHHLPVSGGYMKYNKYIAELHGRLAFVKQQPDIDVVEPERRRHMLNYLKKEAGTMAHLRVHGFEHVPRTSFYRNGRLVMDALREEDGWQWTADDETLDTYLRDAFAAFEQLEALPQPPDTFDVESSYESILAEGWESFDEHTEAALKDFLTTVPEERMESTRAFLGDIPTLKQAAATFGEPEKLVFCHLDMRQENIAWHPDQGTRMIDWSWAGLGLSGSDATSLLIDLHKTGHDVSNYLERLNQQHCLALMGFWLAHSILPNQGASGLRTEQFASALSAYELLVASGS